MNKRWLWVLIGVIAFFVVLFSGAVAGAGLTYFALQARPAQAAREVILDTFTQDDYEAGVLVQHVEKDSPAAEAGIVRGDIILAVAGEQVDSTIEFMDAIEGKSAGDIISLTIQHCETTQDVTLQLEEKNDHIYLGLLPIRERIFDVRPFTRESAPMPVDSPAFIITRVVPDSPADQAGLSPGDMIIAIDEEEFSSEDDLTEIVQSKNPGDEITLSLWSPRLEAPRLVEVTLGENPRDEDQAYLGIEYMPLPAFSGESLEGRRFFHFGMPEFQGEIPPLPNLPEGIMPFMPDFQTLPEGVEQAIVINHVAKASPGEKAGLEAGDLIIGLNGEPVEGIGSLVDTIHSMEPGDEIILSVFRAGEEQPLEVEVVLGENPDIDGQAYLGVKIASFFQLKHFDSPMDQQSPFHFQFEFPWQGEKWFQEKIDPLPGDEA
jgi:S1-C subfamily serine protease